MRTIVGVCGKEKDLEVRRLQKTGQKDAVRRGKKGKSEGKEKKKRVNHKNRDLLARNMKGYERKGER